MMTPRENLHAFYEGGKFEWKPVGSDRKNFQPEEICEYVARAFVFQQEPFDKAKAGGMGWFDIDNFREHTLILEPGDELLLYTDGVNEAFNAKGEQYGNDRLETFLNRHNNERPQPLVEDLGAEIAAWEQGAEQSDDITILAVEYRP